MFFDVLKPWTIIRPESCAEAAHTLARAVGALRRQISPDYQMPDIIGADDSQNDDEIIVINCDEGSKKQGFSWRAGESRVEIYGHAPASLIIAAADFLAALGVYEDADGILSLPPPENGGLYKMYKNHAYNAG
ncbi:MAG: hypothetical protein LBD20_06035 [Spirochaetaceae bacterium]|jgi:hypothetical protein|nr:hypothetical protein [Spirochaetaceae bacterium]